MGCFQGWESPLSSDAGGRGWGSQHPTPSPGRCSPDAHRDADSVRPSVRPSFKFKDQHRAKNGKGQPGAEWLRARGRVASLLQPCWPGQGSSSM